MTLPELCIRRPVMTSLVMFGILGFGLGGLFLLVLPFLDRRAERGGRASLFTWRAATEQFFSHLHPRKRTAPAGALAGETA